MTRLTRTTPAPAPGIVHLGLGAFARAHLALYVQRAIAARGGDWGIVGVSLRSPDVHDALAPQGWAYTAVELGEASEAWQTVGVLAGVLVAPRDPGAVLAAMDGARMVTLTVTEKGYCHDPATGRLNPDHPDIRADLADPGRPVSAIGYLVAALARRRAAAQAPFAVVSLDNLPANGRLLRALVCDLAARSDPALADWITAQVRFPSSMVDRIVPATTPADIARIAALTGCQDAAPVLHEPFCQWVLEDDFAPGTRPDLAAAGVTLVADVAPFEHMKLRMLNAAHSALAYLGYLSGAETMAEASARPDLAAYVTGLWGAEIIPALTPPPGVDLHAYAALLHARFRNPAIRHRTWQIAMDGSLKLPPRLLGTLAQNLAAGRGVHHIATALAGWMHYAAGRDLSGRAIDVRDPLAQDLCRAAAAPDPVAAFLAERRIFPAALAEAPALRTAIREAHGLMAQGGVQAALAAIPRPAPPPG